MTNKLYVHDYGPWHVAPKRESGSPSGIALCGAIHQREKPHWASQAGFENRGVMLVLDDREVCSDCIVEILLEEPNP
jgi:hypothetical protein